MPCESIVYLQTMTCQTWEFVEFGRFRPVDCGLGVEIANRDSKRRWFRLLITTSSKLFT